MNLVKLVELVTQVVEIVLLGVIRVTQLQNLYGKLKNSHFDMGSAICCSFVNWTIGHNATSLVELVTQ